MYGQENVCAFKKNPKKILPANSWFASGRTISREQN
jgi:hypothetical protein